MHAKHLSLATILLTFSLLVLGGVVHNTQSSLACPDWPLCYGSLLPKMEGQILIEHSHRLLAALVGFLNIILVVVTYKQSRPTSNKLTVRSLNLSSLALFLVIVQGILGGITVIYRLPTIVSTSHLALSMIYFCCLILLDHELRYGKSEANLSLRSKNIFGQFWKPIWKHLVFLAAIFVYLQMILGAFIRHVGAGASCGLGPQAWNLCFDVSVWERMWWPVSYPAEIHMTHRYFALVVTAVVVWVGVLLFSKGRTLLRQIQLESQEGAQGFFLIKQLLFLSVLAIISVFVQVLFGVLTVYYNLANIPTAAHLMFAAVLLACLWKLYLVTNTLEDLFGFVRKQSLLSDLVELTKPKLSGLVMMTVLVGLVLAPGEINFFRGLLGLVLVSFVVAGAASLNCYLEREVDAKMERTRERSLPSKRIGPNVALGFGLVLLISSLLGLVIWINWLTALLGLLATILYLLAYTPLKQVTPLAVYVGAIPGAIPPIMGWTMVMGEMGTLAWFLFLILFVWQLPHFLAISIYHAQDYDAASIQVYPNLSGMNSTRRNIFIFSLILFIVTIFPAVAGEASQAYLYAAIVLSGAILIYSMRSFFLPRSEDQYKFWARRYFLATVAYLPLLLGSMIFLQ